MRHVSTTHHGSEPVPLHDRAIDDLRHIRETMEPFNELKKLLGTTDGNLSVHARRLEEAGYIDCRKSFDGRVPRTDERA